MRDKEYLILGKEESYKASSKVWAFQKVDDIIHGIALKLTNMAGGFPFEYKDYRWADSERLYLCGEFSNNTQRHSFIQAELCKSTSGYAAKRFIKAKYKKEIRKDFHTFRLQWMLYCVWQKCRGNAQFRDLLLQIPSDIILLENTTTDTGGSAEIWGAKNKELLNARKSLIENLQIQYQSLPKKELELKINIEKNKLDNIGTWCGQNNIGKILMICRNCLKDKTEPKIDTKLLNDSKIYLHGKLVEI